jgi:hypothetical protein
MVAYWFAAARNGTVVNGIMALGGPLARVRDLRLSGMGSSYPSEVARMLHAAPDLRALAIIGGLRGSPFWYTLAGPEPFGILMAHARVRSIVIRSAVDERRAPTVDTVARLRMQHFPRLRELTVDSVSSTLCR